VAKVVDEMIFLSISYLRGKSNEIVVKELGMVKLNSNGSDSHAQCFMFEPPYGEWELPENIRKSNAYMTRKFHGINWSEGYIPYRQLASVIGQICNGELEIYAKGTEQTAFFTNWCFKFVTDLDSLGCEKADAIALKPSLSCHHPHANRAKHCAMLKCLKYADWMKITLLAKRLEKVLTLF
jgi:hypothetical protein